MAKMIENSLHATDKFSTLLELLQYQAIYNAQQAYTFLIDGEHEEVTLSYAKLDLQAQVIAAQLQDLSKAGERALLLFPPGLEYIAAFFGCLYAGIIAVPVYPPDPTQLNRTLPRLQTITQDAEPTLILTTSSILTMAQAVFSATPAFSGIRWIAIDEIDPHCAEAWKAPDISGKSLAFLQYTSGSTSAPKGVMLSHDNLLHNSKLIYHAFGHSSESHGVIWLPPYHDMGLIGGILQPLYGGFPVTLLSPISFLRKPIRWLQAISHYRATTSGGPNFAYDLCVRKVTPEQLGTLDLSSWQVAFNGAEPVRAETLKRFANTFSSCGFDQKAFYPCYGLAEATLIVSGGNKGSAPTIRRFQKAALEQNQVIEIDSDEADHRVLVSSGRSLSEQTAIIVQPNTLNRCWSNHIGEIWVSGPSVAQGYWKQSSLTTKTFKARLRAGVTMPNGDFVQNPHQDFVDHPSYLRTGDLGFIHEGELFITGRYKDLIIIRGRNYYPQDIELTVEKSHPALRPGYGAAFAIMVGGEEALVIVQEVQRNVLDVRSEEVFSAIQQCLIEQHGLRAHAIALCKAGTIPRTSSGKIQRFACRTGFLENNLALIDSTVFADQLVSDSDRLTEGSFIVDSILCATDKNIRYSLITVYLMKQVTTILRLKSAQIDVEQPLASLGLDSLSATELAYCVERDLRVNVSLVHLFQDNSISQLVAIIEDKLSGKTNKTTTIAITPTLVKQFPLTQGQRALWFLQQLFPESAAYNIAGAVRILSAIQPDILRNAFQTLAERHPALRTTIETLDGEPIQRVHDDIQPFLQQKDARNWSDFERRAYLLSETYSPFDLNQGPLIRVNLLTYTEREHVLLLVIHHIIADFWSLAILVRELGVLYEAMCNDKVAKLPNIQVQYADYARWQTEMLHGDNGEHLWSYWQKKLQGELPILELPTDRPRPQIQTFHGASEIFSLDASLTEHLRNLCQAQKTTLYTSLVATFAVLLQRYSNQEEILIGSPLSDRSRSELATLVGYLINPVVLRINLAGNPTFTEVLEQVRQTVMEALEHQAYPFALLAERLQPHRDPSRTPIFQTMFIWQQVPSTYDDGITGIALGDPNVQLALGGMQLKPFGLTEQSAQFDLTLMMAESSNGLTASFQYNTDLFDASSIQRMVAHFQSILMTLVANPQAKIHNLSLLPSDEQMQMLVKWNSTKTECPMDFCIHELFEVQVSQNPNAVAVTFQGQELSYLELNQRANQLAHHLQCLGIGPDCTVGIYMGRSLEMIVSLLATLKAGGAYVPLSVSHPPDRLRHMMDMANTSVILTQRQLENHVADFPQTVICLDREWPSISQECVENPKSQVTLDNLAYIIYTSGSTGTPKGVMVNHRSVINFFVGMDERIGCGADDTLVAVTNIAFDISVLELFWTLTRGSKITLMAEQSLNEVKLTHAQTVQDDKEIDFSLFYFASDDTESTTEKYHLLTEGAKYADRNGFAAVWTPERHLHAFGGLYPNPAVTSAAVATITKNIHIRAGSIVMPLHNPLRVAEEWSVVDNLSNGRVGLAFASGWHADDFVFYPGNYEDRKMVTWHGIEQIKQLWQGDTIPMRNGIGHIIEARIFPKPIQNDLPIWITAAGNPETFIKAGELGANVLTHLLGQTIDEVAEKIQLYRKTLAANGYDPDAGIVTLMLHTFLDNELETVRRTVREPFIRYLRSSVGLIANLIRHLDLPLNLETMNEKDMDDLLDFAFTRYFETSALFGTPETCQSMIQSLKMIDVDEVACLIDFGIDADDVLESLQYLNALKESSNRPKEIEEMGFVNQIKTECPSLMQCTPSLLRMANTNPTALDYLKSLRTLMLGGEALPPDLADQIHQRLPAQLMNMYGPTETTIWSTTHRVEPGERPILIGRPIANTQIYLLNKWLQPVPVGVTGELYIGGAGVARGYQNQPSLTSEKFIPDPFSNDIGARLYKTGDLARYRPDGNIVFLGRSDYQIKIRGFRIELGEIEHVLIENEYVQEAVVTVREVKGNSQLIAYVVAYGVTHEVCNEIRDWVAGRLPEYMVPALFITLDYLPLNASGKVDRKALPAPDEVRLRSQSNYIAPESQLEQRIAEIWQDALHIEQISIHDNFFDLGGHSLLLVQVHSQLQGDMRQEFPLIRMLEHPTIHTLANYLSYTENKPSDYQQSQTRAKTQKSRRKQQRQRLRIEA